MNEANRVRYARHALINPCHRSRPNQQDSLTPSAPCTLSIGVEHRWGER